MKKTALNATSAAAGGRGNTTSEAALTERDKRQTHAARIAAEWRARSERANQDREAQGLKSGLIELRSQNHTYAAGRATRPQHDMESLLGETSGPVVAKAEFLVSSFGGRVPLGPRPIAYVTAPDNCSRLNPIPVKGVSWMMLPLCNRVS